MRLPATQQTRQMEVSFPDPGNMRGATVPPRHDLPRLADTHDFLERFAPPTLPPSPSRGR